MQTSINLSEATGDAGGADNQKINAIKEQMAHKESQVKNLLDDKAKDRLANLSLVKPQVATAAVETILKQKQLGMLGDSKISDSTLKAILEQINKASGHGVGQVNKTKMVRKKDQWSDDEIIDSEE
eukprot:GHVH01002416.1.p1 GENE.GHVH01002416.1~~GHVH01002416.1.p1  ORF type:complete len:126 (-),score=27.29 GHVH01002416.1:175-552(-)